MPEYIPDSRQWRTLLFAMNPDAELVYTPASVTS